MHVHTWAFIGPVDLRDSRVRSLACERPNLLRCRVPECETELVVKCGTTRSAACEPCGLAHRARVGVVAGSGMRPRYIRRARMHVATDGIFVTLTAPGVRQHKIGKSSRYCTCTPPGGVDLAAWNGSAGKRWNEFCKAVRRAYGEDVEFFKGAEVQRRGALHFHAIFKRRGGGVLAMTETSIRRLALTYGFGHSVDVQRFEPGHAAYVAKYVSKSANDRRRVPWSGTRLLSRRVETLDGRRVDVRVPVDTGSPTYRTWSASRRFGEPMRLVRAAQAHFQATLSALPRWATAEGVDVTPEGFGPAVEDLVPLRPDRVGPPLAPDNA